MYSTSERVHLEIAESPQTQPASFPHLHPLFFALLFDTVDGTTTHPGIQAWNVGHPRLYLLPHFLQLVIQQVLSFLLPTDLKDAVISVMVVFQILRLAHFIERFPVFNCIINKHFLFVKNLNKSTKGELSLFLPPVPPNLSPPTGVSTIKHLVNIPLVLVPYSCMQMHVQMQRSRFCVLFFFF